MCVMPPAHAVPARPGHVAMARELLDETRRAGGLAPVDLGRFWAEDEIAHRDPFSQAIPRVPFGGTLNNLCVFDELKVPEDVWRWDHDQAWRLELARAYNDRAERIVGRRIVSEDPAPDPAAAYPAPGGLHDVFEARNEWHGQSWWLKAAARDPGELSALLDRVDRRDLKSVILPPGWEGAKQRLMPRGIRPPLYRWQRGPVTFAMSVYGVENTIELLMENEPLAIRFRDAIKRVMLGIVDLLDAEAGYAPGEAPGGFQFNDDQCAMLNPAMYGLFGWPILKALFDRLSPKPDDHRGQHSDSAMAHLLPLLGRLDLTYANFGPTLTVTEIREALPRAVIHGQLAPYTYSRNDSEGIVLECLRDVEMARRKRGLVFETAGSINEGTSLASMRLAMSALDRFGRIG